MKVPTSLLTGIVLCYKISIEFKIYRLVHLVHKICLTIIFRLDMCYVCIYVSFNVLFYVMYLYIETFNLCTP